MTFDTFVVGPTNRLAAAAARRAAERPGSSFNPLFLYAASGLGKSHILAAVAGHARRVNPDRTVAYETLEEYMEGLTRALERSGPSALHDAYGDLEILLLDDVQFLIGQPQAQQLLLQTLDRLMSSGAQLVLASDRPPAEIDGLDERLLTRFSGGLIVDMGSPDYETRVAILRKKAEARGMPLGEGVAEAMARYPFRNVRELQGALNRVLAVQDLEGRPVDPSEVRRLLGDGGSDEPAVAEEDGEEAAAEVEARWKHELRGAIHAAESGGFEARRLQELLASVEEPPGWLEDLEDYRGRVRRLEEIAAELDSLGNPWPEEARVLLHDPGRTEDAEQLLGAVRERVRPFPSLPDGPALADIAGEMSALAVRAAEHLLRGDRPEYNPLFMHTSEAGSVLSFLEAAGRHYLAMNPSGKVGLASVEAFSDDFIRALSEGVASAWRERWWSVDVLLLHGVERLGATERAQEEFFHLFEALVRRGAGIILAADRPPGQVEGVDVRLQSRFEGGLVLEVRRESEAPARVASEDPAVPEPSPEAASEGPAVPEPSPEAPRPWALPREKVVWHWPAAEDRMARWEE